MKVGIKKINENDWAVHVGCAEIQMDRFSIELLNLALEQALSLKTGEKHSVLAGYIKLGQKIKELDASNTQKVLRGLNNNDVLILMQVAKDSVLNQQILTNMGGILTKQLESDLKTSPMPDEETAKEAIRRIVEILFDLEGHGEIEFANQSVRYI